jgi:hypothetical protein
MFWQNKHLFLGICVECPRFPGNPPHIVFSIQVVKRMEKQKKGEARPDSEQEVSESQDVSTYENSPNSDEEEGTIQRSTNSNRGRYPVGACTFGTILPGRV